MEGLLPGEWTQGVRRLLTNVSLGPGTSGVRSGMGLFDLILGLRYESGMENYGMLLNANHGLTKFFNEFLPDDWASKFFQTTLPSMARLALNLPYLVRQNADFSKSVMHIFREDVRLRILQCQQPGMVLLSQELAATIVACAFFCLFPGRAKPELPSIDFNYFFACIHENSSERQLHKLVCILHYFERVCESMPDGNVSYERKVLLHGSDVPNASFWSESKLPLCEFLVLEDGRIEDDGDGKEALEVDFANMYLGGGALGSGCVQEEIRFMISPELIAGMLFLPRMQDNEAIEIVGAECYSRYTGYSSSFTFAGDYSDLRPRDTWGRRRTRIVAIDALNVSRDELQQYRYSKILRELNKAFSGFMHPNVDETAVGVSTGNWGCGAFGGDVEMKSMLQWLAASQAGRPFVKYYSFGDRRAERVQEVVERILGESWAVAELWSALCEYGTKRVKSKKMKVGFFDWLLPRTRSRG